MERKKEKGGAFFVSGFVSVCAVICAGTALERFVL